MGSQPRAIGFSATCARLGFSERTGKRLLAEGRFPIPELPRLTPRSPHRYSEVQIDQYLTSAATELRLRRAS